MSDLENSIIENFVIFGCKNLNKPVGRSYIVVAFSVQLKYSFKIEQAPTLYTQRPDNEW